MPKPKMSKGFHPFEKRVITPKEFLSEFGANYKSKEIFPTCLYCGEDVFTYGASSPKVISSFKHHSGKSCSTTSTIGGNIDFDFERGEKLKEEFCEVDTICKSYGLCLNMVGRGNFPTDTFLNLCKKADKRHIWSYIGLEVWMIPYILLTLDDLVITTNKNTTFQIRFVLDKNFDLLSKEKECNIEKIYANSQTMIKSFPINRTKFENINIEWMSEYLIDELSTYS